MALGGSGTIEVVDCLVRGVAGRAFGSSFTAGRFEGTRFEDCGIAIHGTYQAELRGCTFANCTTGIVTGSRFPLRMYDCAFSGNERNWAVDYLHTVAIDCTVDRWEGGSYSAERDTFLVSKRHVIVRVVDAQGEPVKGALVKATVPASPAAGDLDVTVAKTGTDGRTPGEGEVGALLLSELVIRAPQAEGAEPVREGYAWTIEAREGERVGRVEGFAPKESWETVEITITGP